MILESQAQFHSPCFSTILYTPSMPKNITKATLCPQCSLHYPHILSLAHRHERKLSKLFFPQRLSLVPKSQLLLCGHPFPVIKDVMQVLAFSELHLFSKGVSGRHITGLIALAFPVRTKTLPNPQ